MSVRICNFFSGVLVLLERAQASEGAMCRRGEGAWLSPELVECVLSFLPVPALCRFRTVCKSWKELLCTPSFHKLCDAHGNRKPQLFVTQAAEQKGPRALPMSGTTCFLDLDERRWYSIKVLDLSVDGYGAGVMAMDDGLVCKFRGKDEDIAALVLFDPIAKRNRKISVPFKQDYYTSKFPSKMVVSVDDEARSV